MTTPSRSFPALLVLATVLAACGGGEAAKVPRIELDPPDLTAEMEMSYTLAVRNTGDKPLTLTAAPTLAAENCPEDPPGTMPFELQLPAGVTYPVQIAPRSAPGEWPALDTEVFLTVLFTPIAGTCERAAVLTIPSDDPDRPDVKVRLVVVTGEPNILAQPAVVDLGYVPEGETQTSDLTVLNTGLGDLHVKAISYIGAEGFALKWPCTRKDAVDNQTWLAVGAKAVELGSTACEDVVIARNSAITVPIKYQAASADGAKAYLTLFSDDPDYDMGKGEGLQVELRANVGGPCVRVVPTPVDFGAVVVPGVKAVAAHLESCGDQEVTVSGLDLTPDSSADFQVDTSNLGPFNEAEPIVLAAGAKSKDFFVKCVPTKVTKDATGALVPDVGTLVVKNSSPAQALKVPLNCLPVEAQCAVCQFSIRSGGKVIDDGGEVLPQATLTFKDESYDPTDPTLGGGITKRTWDVTAPPDSSEGFNPNPMFPDPKFDANVVGEYEFCLTVENQQGCTDNCCKTVFVKPPEGCHVELTWNTPADPNQSDQCSQAIDCGADMDLHVVHPYATGDVLDTTGQPFGYFDDQYDCYWLNAHPVWRNDHAADPLYQPSLDRDDTDGAGPENWTYTIADPDRCYRLGVHYFDDHGYGKSYPTIKVYISSVTPVYEKTLSKGMNFLDMWDVGRVCCTDLDTPFIEFKAANGDPVVKKNYQSPF